MKFISNLAARGLAFTLHLYLTMSNLKPNFKNLGPKKVLIVDDDIDLRETFDMAFRQEDYEVLSAKDGAEAMDILNQLKEDELPDLIILDFHMPRMNGMVFSHQKAKSELLAPIPVVLLSASGDKKEIREKTVADAYVEKPFDLRGLLDLAHQFIYQVDSKRSPRLA